MFQQHPQALSQHPSLQRSSLSQTTPNQSNQQITRKEPTFAPPPPKNQENYPQKPIPPTHHKKSDSSHKRSRPHSEQTNSPIKRPKLFSSDASEVEDIPSAGQNYEQDFSSDALFNPLVEAINKLYENIDHNLKEKPINRAALEKNLESLEKLIKVDDSSEYHPLLFQKMAALHLALGNKNKASDCMAKAQRRIQQLYFKSINMDSGEERNFSRVKMEIDTEKLFPKIEEVARKENKLKKGHPEDIYTLNKQLDAFVITSEHEHQFLGASSLECKDSFLAIEKTKKRKLSYSKILQEEPNEDKEDDEILKTIKLKQKEIHVLHKEGLKKVEAQEKADIKKYEQTIQTQLQKKEIQRQLAVENTFFDPKRTKNLNVKIFAEKIVAGRYSANGNGQNEIIFDMSKQCARALITAEKTIMQHSINSQYRARIDEDTEYPASLTPTTNNPQNKMSGTKECIKYSNRTADKVQYAIPTDASHNHQGNYFIDYLGNYSDIAKEIRDLIGDNDIHKSKAIAEIMLNFINNAELITEAKLKSIVPPKKDLYKAVGFLTKLCVNFYKEACRRSCPKEKKHQLPYAVGQARGLILAKEGKIHLLKIIEPLKEANQLPEGYDKAQLYGAPYGIATTPGQEGDAIASKNNVDKVNYKLKFINNEYNKYLLEKIQSQKKFPGFFEKNSFQSISTRQQIHQDLLEVYGGENDTDGEGYSSDESYSELPDATIMGPK